MRHALTALLALVLVATAPIVGAAFGHGEVRFHPPVSAAGADMGIQLPQASYAAMYGSPDGFRLEASGTGEDVVATFIRATGEYYSVGDVNTTPPGQEDAVERTTTRFAAASLHIAPLTPEFTFILQSEGPVTSNASHAIIRSIKSGTWLSSGPNAPSFDSLEPFPRHPPTWPNVHEIRIPGPHHHAESGHLELRTEGRIQIYLAGGQAVLTNATGRHVVQTGVETRHDPDAPPPLGPARTVIVRTGVLIELEGELTASYRGPHGHVLATEVSLSNVEALAAPLATAVLHVEGAAHSFTDASHLDIEGLFTVAFPRAATGEDGIIAVLDGEFHRIQENRFISHDLDPIAPEAAAAVALGLLVAVWVIVSWIRRGAAWIAFQWGAYAWLTWAPLAAKPSRTKVLPHPIRDALLGFLKQGGVPQRLSEVRRHASQTLGLSSSTVYYHLRLMCRAGVVNALKPGRGGAVYVEPKPERRQGTGLGLAAVLLQQEIRRLLAESILATPGLTQTQLHAAIQRKLRERQAGPRRTISKVTIHKHLRILEHRPLDADGSTVQDDEARGADPEAAAGLVRGERDGRTIRYWPQEALAAFLGATGTK